MTLHKYTEDEAVKVLKLIGWAVLREVGSIDSLKPRALIPFPFPIGLTDGVSWPGLGVMDQTPHRYHETIIQWHEAGWINLQSFANLG